MPTFEATCPHCQTHYSLDLSFQGRVAVCRNCRTQFTLPLSDDTPTANVAEMEGGNAASDSSFSLAMAEMEGKQERTDSPPKNSKTPTKTISSSTDVAKKQAGKSTIWKVGDVLLGVYEVRPMPDGQPYAEGGVGLVHRVYHREWDIELAVKSPKPDVFHVETGKLNYERECQTWIELGLHPNIVTCYLVRRIDGIPRLFAELVPDGSLNDWMRDGRLYLGTPEEKLKRVFDIAIQFCWGLDYSHKQGVLHLDVKPANVMLAGQNVKVTDFGLARAMTLAEVDSPMQWEGMTPGYCSPEQYEAFLLYKSGSKNGGPPITAQSDIWSWAISLLAMFHGRAPCKKGGQTADKVFDQYLRTVHSEFKPQMPQQLAELLMHCFQKNPEQRPRSMGEVAGRLAEIYQEIFGEKYPRHQPPMTSSTAESLNNRAVSLLDLNKPSEAKNLFQQAFRLHPWQPQVTFNQAIQNWRAGGWTDLEMLRQVESLIHLRPNDAASYHAFGLAQRERGNLEEAKIALQKAVDMDSKAEYQRHLRSVETLTEQSVRCLERFQIFSTEKPSVFLSQEERLLLFSVSADSLTVCDTKTGRPMVRFRKSGSILVDEMNDRSGSFSMLSEDMSWELKRGTSPDVFLLSHLKNDQNSFSFQPIAWNLSAFPGQVQIREGIPSIVNPNGQVAPLTGHTGIALSISSDLKRQYAVTGGADKTVRLWELQTKHCLRTFRDGEGLVQSVYMSGNRSFVLSLADRSILKLWRTHLLLNEPMRVRSPVMLCLMSSAEEVSQNQSELVHFSEQAQNAAQLGDYTQTLELIEKMRRRPGWETLKGSINLWELLGRHCLKESVAEVLCCSTFSEHEDIVSSVAISSNGKTAISGGRDHSVFLWDVEKKVCSGIFEGHHDWVRTVDITFDGRFAVSGAWDQTIKLWDIEKMELIRTFDERIRSIGQVAFSPDAHNIAASSAGGAIALLDAVTGKTLGLWQAHDAPVRTTRFSRDGAFLLTAGEDGKTCLWDVAKKTAVHSLKTHHCPVMAAVLTTDMSRIISAGSDGIIHICRLNEEKIVPQVLKGHLGAVTALTMTADDRWLISGSKDATLRFWNLETGESMKSLTLHSKQITDLAIDLSGTRLLSSSEDQTVRIWDIDWSYDFPGWQDTAPTLDDTLRVLLRAHQMTGETSTSEIMEQLFWRIRTELEVRGFGWIRPEAIWTRLHELIQQ